MPMTNTGTHGKDGGGVSVVRYIGVLGTGTAGFLIVSPSMRESVGEWGLNLQAYLVAHSPYSWAEVAGGALLAMWLLARSACNNPRV